MRIPSPLLASIFSFVRSVTSHAAAAATPGSVSPDRALQAPLFGITPAPDRRHVSHRLLRARQGDQRSSDGRTSFIGWYVQSNSWISATCPPQDYFAADEQFGVCCHRENPYCDLATSCGGPYNNYAVGLNGQADW
ncbi:hypothetical protein CCHL11_09271 [Colletotrichum chlorophyti]|uniref:Uncharacterized protein n=1 Tax=Colletotrichum chlorophyti TaxID=708187 RepID=A0A1Q8RC69_9PEZI|nr:hypothetical protein CCHL11_09271 [Colletotrichum chlorophyti]